MHSFATTAASASALAALLPLLSLFLLPLVAEGHPLCLYGPDRAVSTTAEATFCPNDDPEGFCCEPAEEDALSLKFDTISGTLSAECAPLYKEVSWWLELGFGVVVAGAKR